MASAAMDNASEGEASSMLVDDDASESSSVWGGATEDENSMYTNMMDWREWKPGPWNKFARYHSKVEIVEDKYAEKGYHKFNVADMSKPKDPHRFVDVCPRKDHRGKDLVSEEFKEKNTMRINLPLGDFHEGDECEFFSLVDSKWYSDGIIMHEHPYTGALAVAFDRSEPGKQHSKSSRFAVISRHDAQDRLILNRDGRASKVLANRGMSAMGKKKLRRRPIFMSNLVWRQRLAAMTPLNVVAGGNLHSLRAQAKHLGLISKGMDEKGLLAMIHKHIKKAQTSEVNKFLASRIAAAEASAQKDGVPKILSRSFEERLKLREKAIKNKWLVHTRSLQGGDGESLQLSAEAAAERDALVLPSIEEHRRQQKKRLSQLPSNVRAPIRSDHAVKPDYLGRQLTNDGDDILEDRAGYSAWKQYLHYKGREAYEDEVHHTGDVRLKKLAFDPIPEEHLQQLSQLKQGMDQELVERQKWESMQAGVDAPTEYQHWEATEYQLRQDVKRIEVQVKANVTDPSKKFKESAAGQKLVQAGKYIY